MKKETRKRIMAKATRRMKIRKRGEKQGRGSKNQKMARPGVRWLEFNKTPDGFTIGRPEPSPVSIVEIPTGFLLTHQGLDWEEFYGFCNLRGLAAATARMDIFQAWPSSPRGTWQNPTKALRDRLRPRLEEHLSKADPNILAFQRKVFAETLRSPGILRSETIYRDSYISADVSRFRAAAIAVGHFEQLVEKHDGRPLEIENETTQVPIASVGRQCEILGGWRDLFSSTCKAYASLNRTLECLPGGLGESVCALGDVKLRRPITSRLELATLLAFSELETWNLLYNWDLEDYRTLSRFEPVFMFAKEDQIKRGMAAVSRQTDNWLSPRKLEDIKFFVGYLISYPEGHNGNIVGLTKKSIRWHRHRHGAILEETLKEHGGETVVLPPVPLPENPRVSFLDSVSGIVEEGRSMDHCVASYVDQAIRGHSYFFHISAMGETATVQVDSSGNVLQSHGPRNKRNNAAEWGKNELQRWGKSLPAHTGQRGGLDGLRY